MATKEEMEIVGKANNKIKLFEKLNKYIFYGLLLISLGVIIIWNFSGISFDYNTEIKIGVFLLQVFCLRAIVHVIFGLLVRKEKKKIKAVTNGCVNKEQNLISESVSE